MFTIYRFVHGASIHIDVISKDRHKTAIDFFAFYIQGGSFYLMAISLNNALFFLFWLVFMLTADAIWIIYLLIKWNNNIQFKSTTKQWLISDFIIILLLIIIEILLFLEWSSFWLSIKIMIVCVIATIIDYKINKEFYFPE